MTNIFKDIISNEFKELFNNAIDSLLTDTSLTIPCRLKYYSDGNISFCNNCLYDSISKLSSNMYNNTGPNAFKSGSICPVCFGRGSISSDSQEVLYLSVMFDSKYWLNKSANIINIPNGGVQTLCLLSYLPKIRNVNEIVFDTTIEGYGNYIYERNGDPEPVGFGSNRYIITMWKRK